MSLLTKTKVVSFLVIATCLVGSAWLVANRQHVVDQIIVWQFQPSSQIEKIADRAYMSATGEFYFYASQPEIEATQKFNRECERKEQHSAILGCYSNGRIYIFDVKNKQLDGIEEVTAAHEMLHTVWDRLSEEERAKLTTLLEAAYKKVATTELKERMDYYARTQPGERGNELHSILATEFRDLGSELEKHYRQYFTDRDALVSLHYQYQKIFTQLENRTTQLVSEMNTLAGSIERDTRSYNAGVATLNADIASFNDRARRGSFSSESEFNTARSDLGARARTLEQQRSSIAARIVRYNALRQELKKISIQSSELQQSIDSSLAPVSPLE